MKRITTTFAKLTQDTGIYALVFGLQRAVGFAMLPVYTRYLGPSDYGVMQLLDMTVDIGAILFTAGMSSAVQRFFVRAPSEEVRKRVVSTAFIIEVGLSLIGALLIFAFAPQIHSIAHGGAGSPDLVRIAAVNLSLSMLCAVPMVMMQTMQRSGLVLAVSAVKLVLQVGLNVYFLVQHGAGVKGILLSTAITNLVIGTALTIWLLRRVGFGVDRVILRALARYGISVQVATAGSFVLAFADRLFLLPSHGVVEVGLYGLTCQFGFLLGQLSGQPFLAAWNPHRHELALQPVEQRDAKYRKGFLFFNVFLLTTATAIGLFVTPVLHVMTQPEFHAAARLVPVILLAYVFQWWMYAVAFGLEVTARTSHIAVATWISVGVGAVLYSSLIPAYGATGAAIATLITFVLRFLLVYRKAQQIWPVTYDWWPALQLLGFAGVAVATATWYSTGQLLVDVGLGVVLFAAYGAAVGFVVLSKEQRGQLMRVARSPRRSFDGLARVGEEGE